VEANQIDILTATVFCDFEQIQDTEKTRFARQLRSDVGKSDGLDGVDFDRAVLHAVALADGDARAKPEPDRTRDFAAADAFAQAFGEDHERTVAREASVLSRQSSVFSQTKIGK